MFVRNGQMLGSGVPRDKRGIPAPAERTTVPVSPAVARSIKKARTKSEPPQDIEEVETTNDFGKVEQVLTEIEKEADEQATQAEVDEPEVDEPPKDYAAKSDWVAYAVSRGADRDEAETLTKAELIDLYGGD